jgi:H+/Cl- antiporter ClcA
MAVLLQDVRISGKFRTKTTEMRQPLCILSPFFFVCSLVLFFLFLFFLFFLFFFCFCFFDVTEGEKQGSGIDSVCGVIKREMVAAR